MSQRIKCNECGYVYYEHICQECGGTFISRSHRAKFCPGHGRKQYYAAWYKKNKANIKVKRELRKHGGRIIISDFNKEKISQMKKAAEAGA